ncbi:MAG: ABC transporter ATP-binding protein [Roseiflexaceae bacterium]|nr:ABC transporter ATP-binding protein [Roseiflexaceae bacterium]
MTNSNGASLPRPQLEIDGVSLDFGGVRALFDVRFNVYPGTIQAIIGPNGAGKTSLLNCISGLYRPQRGAIRFEGHNIVGMAPHHIARLGIARSFQNIELFRHMTVLDNLMLGRHIHMRSGILSNGLYWGRTQREEIAHREIVERVIDLLEIEFIRKKVVGALPYGLQKRVELGRALAMSPRLLLLDEPMAGMNSEEKEDMARFILDVNEEWGATIVLIEHDMGVVMDISDRVAVLEFGQLIADGTPDEVRADPKVIDAYLGREHAIR